ncbi:MAG: CooT family nickel-binding protein [Nitrospirae bacterium]|nr:CooT family nickel-binding protein [Nitrospirota bacterium]
MCEAKAYIINNEGKEELLLEAVSSVKKEGDKIFLRNIFAEEKEIEGEIKEISLTKNKIILKKKG